MIEIFRLQILQILGGRKKWLVFLFSALPVLLTYVVINLGGLHELKKEKGEGGKSPATLEKAPPSRMLLFTEDEPIRLMKDLIVVTKDQIFYQGKPVPKDWQININNGYITVKDGKAWIDPKRKRRDSDMTIRIVHGGTPFQASVEDFFQWEDYCAIYPHTACR